MSPRSKEQYKEIRQNRKEQILHQALHLFAEKGYESTSISMIAKAAEVSKGLLYNYFDNKEDLLNKVMTQGIQQIMLPLEQENLKMETPAEFRAFVEGNFAELMRNQEHWKLYFSLMVQPSISKKTATLIEKLVTPWLQMLENYYRIQGYQNPRGRAVLLGAMLDGIGIQLLMNQSRSSILGSPINAIKEMIIEYFG